MKLHKIFWMKLWQLWELFVLIHSIFKMKETETALGTELVQV